MSTDPGRSPLVKPWSRRALVGATIGATAGVSLLRSQGVAARQLDESAANEVMTRRPFAPTDIELLNPSAYPDASEMTPASGPEPTEGEARDILEDSFDDGFPRANQRRRRALAVFDDPAAIAKVSHSSLRAALAALVGTFAEPAIETILHGTQPSGDPLFNTVQFFDLTSRGTQLYAFVETDLSTGETYIAFEALYASENPLLFARMMVHEPSIRTVQTITVTTASMRRRRTSRWTPFSISSRLRANRTWLELEQAYRGSTTPTR